jgi:hypothetical protein
MTADFLTEAFGFANLTSEELEDAKDGQHSKMFDSITDLQSRKVQSILNISRDGN